MARRHPRGASRGTLLQLVLLAAAGIFTSHAQSVPAGLLYWCATAEGGPNMAAVGLGQPRSTWGVNLAQPQVRAARSFSSPSAFVLLLSNLSHCERHARHSSSNSALHYVFAHSPSSQAASACHVYSALSDNVAYTFTNGTDYPLNTNPASNAYAIAPASCQVSRASP